jgi:hypothetical protein
MDDESIPIQEALIRGVNWAPDSCDEEDDYEPIHRSTLCSRLIAPPPLMDHEDILVQESLIHGTIWAPDSCDEEDLADAGEEEMIGMSKSSINMQ